MGTNLEYGIIGNGRSAALVSRHGQIDWCCLADFDSPSVFAALLDDTRGGCFLLGAASETAQVEQQYLRNTNVLRTRFSAPDGEFELLDFMPRYHDDNDTCHCPPDIVRIVRVLRGTPVLRFLFDPRLGYAEHATRVFVYRDFIKAETTAGAHESVYLYASVPLRASPEAQFITLQHDAFFWLSYNQKIGPVDLERAELEFARTKVYWLNWCARTTPTRCYSDAIRRSALVLKLLSFQETGAILAAPTTSLPETIGEERNWDYRFCWIRDASMIMRTLVTLGHQRVAHKFFEFLLDVVPYKNDHIQIMYSIRGKRNLEEVELKWLNGYEDSRPVRIGNAAWSQQQNDIYGVLLDAIYQGFILFRGQSAALEALWTMTRGIVRHLHTHWRTPDQGIWEIRGAPQHFTHSKVMCWVGFDRAIKVAALLGFHDFVDQWTIERVEIRADILEHAYDNALGSFTQSYGKPHLDAATLLMWKMGFIEANDPRWVSTVRTIYKELCVDGLMYRYRNPDDFGQPQSAFTVCTFWMIQALSGIGEHEQARAMFERILGLGNHLGLFSEDLDFRTHRLLGNFPQGYSHLAIIDTALLLESQSGPRPT